MAAARAAGLALGDGVRFARPSGLDAYLAGSRPAEPRRPRRARARCGPAADSSPARRARSSSARRRRLRVQRQRGLQPRPLHGAHRGALRRRPRVRRDGDELGLRPRLPGRDAPLRPLPRHYLATTSGWADAEDFDVDVAFANVAPNAAGSGSGTRSAGRRSRSGRARAQATDAFGYPAVAPWTGARLVACSGAVAQDTTPAPSTDQGMACTMTPGSSGGPWFTGFDPRTGTGTLTSVTSFSYTDQPGVLWGPYLGAEAQALYDAVASTTTADLTRPLALIMEAAVIMDRRQDHRGFHDQRGRERVRGRCRRTWSRGTPRCPRRRPRGRSRTALTPPNGAAGLDTMPWLSPTMPVSRPSATAQRARQVAGERVGDQAVLGVVGQRAAPRRPSANVVTGATGPKISSREHPRLRRARRSSTVGA